VDARRRTSTPNRSPRSRPRRLEIGRPPSSRPPAPLHRIRPGVLGIELYDWRMKDRDPGDARRPVRAEVRHAAGVAGTGPTEGTQLAAMRIWARSKPDTHAGRPVERRSWTEPIGCPHGPTTPLVIPFGRPERRLAKQCEAAMFAPKRRCLGRIERGRAEPLNAGRRHAPMVLLPFERGS